MTSSSSESVSNRSGPHRSGGSNQQDHSSSNENVYECNICFDSATDPVVSMCGHLFCWPCLHQWLETRPSRKECPVCKSGIDRDKVIPVYSRGGTNQQDPRDKIPPRPQGQRTEPENNNAFPGFGFSEGFQMSFGIGAFPFSMFWANNGGRPQANTAAGHPPNQTLEDQFLSRIFLFAAIIFLLWLLVS